ncbi:UNVERIFIED_CONTAM: hypothetical protein Sindi_2484800 [Sesamum indicum]
MAGYNLQPFDGKGDFSIWQQKMKSILIQQKVFKAIDEKSAKQYTARDLWEKLEELYTDTSLSSKLFLLEKFFKYKLDLSKNIDENLDDFTKLIQDIKLTGDENIDDYSPIVLLNAIPDAYSDVKAAIKYGRDSVSLDIVVNDLKSKEIDLKTNRTSNNQHEVNSVRGRSKFRNSSNRHNSRSKSRNRNNNRSKSRNTDYSYKDDKVRERRCYNCGIKGHYIKDCRKPRRDNRDNNGEEKERVNNVADESGEVFIVSDVNSVHPMNMYE